MAPAMVHHMANYGGGAMAHPDPGKPKSSMISSLLSPFHRIYLRFGRSVDRHQNHERNSDPPEILSTQQFSKDMERLQRSAGFWKVCVIST